MKRLFIITLGFLLIISALDTNAGFFDFLSGKNNYSKDNIFTSIDSNLASVEDSVLEINLRGNDKTGDISESLQNFCKSMGLNFEFKENITVKELKQIHAQEEGYFKVLLGILKPKDRAYITQKELKHLIRVVTSYVDISKENANSQVEQIYRLSNIGLYSDGDLENSGFDLIEDLDDINAMLYGLEDSYDDSGLESNDTGNLEKLLNSDIEDPSRFEHEKNNKQEEVNITQANIGQNVVLNPETIDEIEIFLGNLKVMTLDEFRAKFIEMLDDLNVDPEIRDGIMDLLDNVLSPAKLKENIEDILTGLGVEQDIIDKVKEIVDAFPDLNQMKTKILETLEEAGLEQENLDYVEEVFENIGIPSDVIDEIDKLLQQAGIDKPARDNLRTFLESFGIDKTLSEQADYIGGKLRCAVNDSGLSMRALDVLDNPANRNEDNDEGVDGMVDYLTPGFSIGTGNKDENNVNRNSGTGTYNPFGETFNCSPEDIFCILISMKSYTMNMVGTYKEDMWGISFAGILAHYNEFFRKGAYSSLSQKRMAINNFEFGYPLDLKDLFASAVYLSYEPIPIYNLEEEEGGKTNSYPDDLANPERLMKKSFEAYGLNFDRQNNLALLTQDLEKKTNILNSESGEIDKISDELQKQTDMSNRQKNMLKQIELDIDNLTSNQNDFTDFNKSFLQISGALKAVKGFSKDIYGIANRMTKIPYK